MKLQFSKPKYHSYDNERIITCSYQCNIIDDERRIIKSFKTIGKAVVAPGDVPNTKLGKRIAEGKAKKKAYNKGYLIIRNQFLPIHKLHEEQEQFLHQMKYLIVDEIKHLDDLILD